MIWEEKTHKKEPDTREWVLVIEAVSAIGRILRHLFICKDKNSQTRWFNPNQVTDWVYRPSKINLTSKLAGLQ